MASTSETGHAQNVAKLEELIGYCTGYGAAYNPSKASIKLTALNTLLANAQASLTTLKAAKTAFDNGTNAREIVFKPLKKLVTRAVNSLASTDAAKQTVDDAIAINLTIQGRRAGGKPEAKKAKEGEPGKQGKSASVSQQSFDSQVENFAKLIQTLTAEVLYKPNEPELQVASLNTLLTSMKDKNKTADAVITNLSNARIARDKILYASNTGIYDIADAVKKYVLSVYSAGSPQHKQVSKIKFTNNK